MVYVVLTFKNPLKFMFIIFGLCRCRHHDRYGEIIAKEARVTLSEKPFKSCN